MDPYCAGALFVERVPPCFLFVSVWVLLKKCCLVYVDSLVRFWNAFRIISSSFHCGVLVAFIVGCSLVIVFPMSTEPTNETTAIGLCTDTPVGTLSVRLIA